MSDITKTYQQNSTISGYIFDNCPVDITSYKYLIIQPSQVSSSNSGQNLQLVVPSTNNGTTSFYIPVYKGKYWLYEAFSDSFSSDPNDSTKCVQINTDHTAKYDVTFTLTDSLPGEAQECEECQECQETECPVGEYHEDLTNIYGAIIMCGGVIMVLYFFYCIYRILIKSTGGWS